MRQLLEERALLEAAVNALAELLAPALPVELLAQAGHPSQLRIGEQATFTLRGQPGWRGTLPAAGQLAANEVLEQFSG